MRYRVIMQTGATSPYSPDKEHVADFRHAQHAIGFADKLLARAYVVDCFDDTIIHKNKD